MSRRSSNLDGGMNHLTRPLVREHGQFLRCCPRGRLHLSSGGYPPLLVDRRWNRREGDRRPECCSHNSRSFALTVTTPLLSKWLDGYDCQLADPSWRISARYS